MKTKAGAIIAAAGSSNRMGSIDKLFATVAGKPLLFHVLIAFESCSDVEQIVLVLAEHNTRRGRNLVKRYGLVKVTDVVSGGPRRQDSVRLGLARLAECETVVIHDGARPMVTTGIIEKGIEMANSHGTAVAAVPAKNTIKVADSDDYVTQTLKRESLWEIQTPQVFRYDIIAQAYKDISGDATDDATLVERSGHKVRLYMAAYDNIKVTTVEDLYLARLIYKTRGK